MSTTLYIILGVTLVALIVLSVLYFIKKKKAKEDAGAEETNAPGGDEMSLLIREAEARLAAARIEKGAKVANLPAFVLMGDSGTTKTSVIVHSGLDPELLAGQVYVNNDVVPTRTANIWFSRRTLFIEAGGALPADTGKWKKFVKKLQPKTSVVGKGEQAPRAAVVCFDAENFTQGGAQEAAAASARTLRARLGEISQALGINLPVYVLFTRMDRLPFFLDYVRNLSEAEAGQVLGVTLPMVKDRNEGVYAEQETARLTYDFERLFHSLADARPEFLARETDETRLPGAYEFPREFRKVRPVLVQFLVDLCRPSQLTVAPFLRGFYFTGVRPVVVNEAAPIVAAAPKQAAQDAMAGATGIFGMAQPAQAAAARQAAPNAVTRKVPQWVFLTQLFSSVLLADSTALGASGASTKTNVGRRILFICAASLCLLLSLFFTISYFKNRALQKQVYAAATAISLAPVAGGDLAPVDQLRNLETLRVALERLGGYQRAGAPFTYRFGLYTVPKLYPEARRIYFSRFRQLLLGQTQAGMLQFLQTLPPKPGPDYNPTYEALKGYLITTSNPDKSTREFLTPVLMRWWSNGRTVDAPRSSLAQKQFDFYADELRIQNPFSGNQDTGGVARARQYLSQFAGVERVYAFMISEANRRNPAVNYHKQFPEASKVMLETHEVPGAFSKGGWAFMKDAIPNAEKYFAGEEWVLGKQSGGSMDAAALQQAIRARYYADFLSQWRTYIRSGSVVRYTGIPDAAQKLSLTAGATSPLLALVCLASENTAVDEPAVAAPFQPVQVVVPPGCLARYANPTNQNYMTALLNLQSSLEQLPPNPDAAAAAPTLSNATQAKIATRQVAQNFRSDADLGGAVQKLLEDPITNAEGVLRGVGPAALNAKGKGLCTQISPLFAKYPFNPTSQTQASLQDVNAIYHPKEGAIWKFHEADLAKFVTRQGVPVEGAPVALTPAFRGFLQRAAAFTDAAYQGGSADPHLTYSVKPDIGPDTDRIKVSIDGQAAEFVGAGAAAKNFVWPGSAHGVQLTLIPKGGGGYDYPTYDGLWAVFRFVADADKRAGNMMEMTLRAGRSGQAVLNRVTNQPVTVRLDMVANPPVFDKGYFSTLGCVAEVAKQ
jgi:type VI secretion system protein ImpL